MIHLFAVVGVHKGMNCFLGEVYGLQMDRSLLYFHIWNSFDS